MIKIFFNQKAEKNATLNKYLDPVIKLNVDDFKLLYDGNKPVVH